MLDWFLNQDIINKILMSVLGVSAILQLFYFWVIYGKIAFYKKNKKSTLNNSKLPPVSIIVVAENDFFNLKKNLTSLLEQDYPIFQVVVINIDSQDNTSSSLLKAFRNQYSHLKIVDLPEVRASYSRKKFMLDLGVKESAYDLLVFTNSDCKPDSPLWIRSMVMSLHDEKELSLGYAGLKSVASLANKFYRLDIINNNLTYLSLACCGMPYTGSGNNLAYTRTLFTKAKGHTKQYAIPYGDDTLFINSNASKSNINVVLDAHSLIRIQSKMTFHRWTHQKKSARLSQRHYKMWQRFILAIFPLTRLFFYATFIALLCLLPFNVFYYSILSVFIFRLISQLIITNQVLNKFKEKGVLFCAPLFEPFYMLFSWSIFFKTLFIKRNH